ncbi:hypothetical protein N7493_009284 [Penicillium malachiteum]|uniref:Uncharacterized protein n=1 Tax=Penicillium malachiteum TaxID=1324776 RepID=A0AAD6MT82_9EURO|nr:hypothetical protein N7493_009284 [Penicillium malachiteum]
MSKILTRIPVEMLQLSNSIQMLKSKGFVDLSAVSNSLGKPVQFLSDCVSQSVSLNAGAEFYRADSFVDLAHKSECSSLEDVVVVDVEIFPDLSEVLAVWAHSFDGGVGPGLWSGSSSSYGRHLGLLKVYGV